MMLEFMKDADISYYDKLTKLLCKAIDTGNEGMEVDSILTANQCLKAVICNGLYTFFPKKDNIRNDLKGYLPEEFANLVINNVRNADHKLYNQCVKEVNGVFHVERDDMTLLIECFVSNFLADKIKINPNFDEVDEEPEVKKAIESAEFLSPSSEFRESIINGTQTNLRKSSAKFNGISAYSDMGTTRENQEDSYYIGVHPNNPNFKIMVVADGMGGYKSGEIASNIAVREMMMWFESLSLNYYLSHDNTNLIEDIKNKIEEIQDKICDEVFNGGTTLCFAIIKSDSIVIGNIGDSQGYVIEDGKLVCATNPQNKPSYENVPKELVRYHSNSNSIYSYLGKTLSNAANHDMEFYEVNISKDHEYRVIICSDGVSDCVSERDIVNTALNEQDVSERLVKLAIANTSYLKDEQLSDEALKYKEMHPDKFNSVITGGKDNTTAVSTTIHR